MSPRVLIVEDGLGPHPLAAARSFGAAGWHVGIGAPVPCGRAGSSRWARAWHRVPPAELDPEAFLAATREAIDQGPYDIVFGGDDVEVLALSVGREQLPAVVPYPPHATVLQVIDKRTLTLAAQDAGLAVPRTVAAEDGLGDLPFPVVVKARTHWTPGQRGVPARLDRSFCATAEEVAEAVGRIARAGGAAIIQEVVHGDLMALTLLFDRDGGLVARVQQEARRISPNWHNSVRAETVTVDEELSAGAQRMLVGLGWWGLANMQFLRPAGGGAPRLIDFNGRFYGSLSLAVASGADLPVLWARVALGEPAPSAVPVPTRVGVRYQSLDEDLRRAVLERRGGLMADLGSTIAYARGAVHSTWSPDDVRPAVRRCAALLRSEASALAGRSMRGLLHRDRRHE